MTETIIINAVGTPQPQGSKRGFVRGGRAVVVDDNKPALRTWRGDVIDAALGVGQTMLAGPVEITITFALRRPNGHYGTGRNAGTVRGSAPSHPAVKPDLDKLTRSTLDALREAGIYRDDAQVVTITAAKRYADGRPPGAHITIRTIGGLTT